MLSVCTKGPAREELLKDFRSLSLNSQHHPLSLSNNFHHNIIKFIETIKTIKDFGTQIPLVTHIHSSNLNLDS